MKRWLILIWGLIFWAPVAYPSLNIPQSQVKFHSLVQTFFHSFITKKLAVFTTPFFHIFSPVTLTIYLDDCRIMDNPI